MPEGQITPNEPEPDAGVGDILPDGGVSAQEGSEGDGEFAALAEKFGIDLENVPEEARGEVEIALRTAENAVHSLREEDSLEMDGLKDKAALYDRFVSTQPSSFAPATPMPAGASPPTQEALFVGSEVEAAISSEDPEAFARMLTKGVEKAAARSAEKLGTERLVPMEKTITTMVEMQLLDGKYPGWREDLPKVRQVLQSHPDYSIQQAYESGVVVPRYNRQSQRDAGAFKTARDKRREAVKNEPKPASVGPTGIANKVYDTDKDAILAAIEAEELSHK